MRDIRFYIGMETLKFLGECAVGIHSVTVGDSQVLSQISDGLLSGVHGDMSPFRFISNWSRDLALECASKTKIFEGNTSLERIASELITKKTAPGKTVLLVGYGKSGRLIAKILSNENDIPLQIVNRTAVDFALDHLDATKVAYTTFKDFTWSDDIDCIVVAVKNNLETEKVLEELLGKIENPEKTIVVDLSAFSSVSEKTKNLIDIKMLSGLADENISARKREVDKARDVVHKSLETIVGQINKNVSKLYMNKQKNSTFKRLDVDKVDLVVYRSKVCKIIRDYLDGNKFIEVTTPYIVGISTDPPKVDKGGTINVDWINGGSAFLRQSNQIYKQILVASGLKKIYEIGPFWRRETSESYRHLQESIGLDIEISNPRNLKELYSLACSIIKKVHDLTKGVRGSRRLVLPEIDKIPVLTYFEAVDLLAQSGNPVTKGDDLGLVGEAKLGQLIKARDGSDIFVIKDYPDTIKKFYTKNKSPGLTESFDIILNGWELVSGAIRQTDGKQIRKSMQLSGIDPNNYEFYISIVDKAIEHGGFCIGLDRLVAKIMDKEMISDAVPFPRTYRKLIP